MQSAKKASNKKENSLKQTYIKMKTENWVYEQREIWVEGTNTRIAKVTGKDKRPIGYLISASPELLGALQNIIDAHENDDTKQYGILIEQGKSAIKKALNLA